MNLKYITTSLFCVALSVGSTTGHAEGVQPSLSTTCPALLNHDMQQLRGTKQNLCEAYQGKVLLLVNTASDCGFTSQFAGLQALYEKYKDQGLVVLGFSSNDFFQERENEADVYTLCRVNYGVTFPMFAQTSVAGKNANPVFKSLAAQGASLPRWNFFKYVVGKDGQLIDSFGSSVKPSDKSLVAALELALKKH